MNTGASRPRKTPMIPTALMLPLLSLAQEPALVSLEATTVDTAVGR